MELYFSFGSEDATLGHFPLHYFLFLPNQKSVTISLVNAAFKTAGRVGSKL